MVEQRWMRCGVRGQCNSAVSSSPSRVDRWCSSPNGRSGRDNCPKQLHCPAQQSLQSFAPLFSHLTLATRPASKKSTMMLHTKFPYCTIGTCLHHSGLPDENKTKSYCLYQLCDGCEAV